MLYVMQMMVSDGLRAYKQGGPSRDSEFMEDKGGSTMPEVICSRLERDRERENEREDKLEQCTNFFVWHLSVSVTLSVMHVGNCS